MYPPSIHAAMRKPSFWLHTSTAVFFFFSHSLSSFHRLFLLAFPCWPAGSCSFRFSSFVWARKSLHKNNNKKKTQRNQVLNHDIRIWIHIYIYKKSTTLLRQFLFPSNVWTPHKIPQKLTVKQKQKRTNKQNKKKQIISISTIQCLVIIILLCYGRISSRIIVYVLFYAWSHGCLEVSASGAEIS